MDRMTDPTADARQRLAAAHRAQKAAAGAAEVAKAALARAKGHVDAIARELADITAVQNHAVATDAETLAGRLRAGLVADTPTASRAGLDARARRNEVEARHAAADAAFALLAGEARAAQEEADAAEEAKTEAAAAVLQSHATAMAVDILDSAARLKSLTADFAALGMAGGTLQTTVIFEAGQIGALLTDLRSLRTDPGPDWPGYRERLLTDPDATPIPA